jgi:hypothetical protein
MSWFTSDSGPDLEECVGLFSTVESPASGHIHGYLADFSVLIRWTMEDTAKAAEYPGIRIEGGNE